VEVHTAGEQKSKPAILPRMNLSELSEMKEETRSSRATMGVKKQ
jgi:hypothetical protein